jgi:hypothetical protein
MNGMTLRSSPSNFGSCSWQFSNIGNATQVIIGQPFIWQYYTVFDTDNAQIGIATMKLNQFAAPFFGPWISTAGSSPAPEPTPSSIIEMPTYANDEYY